MIKHQPPITNYQSPTIIHSLPDCLQALRTNHQSPPYLQTAPGMMTSHGCLYIREMEAEAHRACPEAEFHLIVDCDTTPGHAMAALREGCQHIRFTGDEAVKQKLKAIAAEVGAEVV